MPDIPYASDEHLQSVFGQAQTDLMRQADAHTMAVQAWLASRSPDVRWLDCSGSAVVTTGMKVRLFNQALGFNFPADISEADLQAEINRVRLFYKARHTPWLWWVGPNPTPADVHQHMTRAGFSEPGSLPCMVAPVRGHAKTPEPSLEVWRTRTTHDLRAASRIRHAAFRFPEGEGTTYFEDMEESWLSEDSIATLYLAGPDQSTPLGMGAVIWGADIPGIYIMATHPDAGRRGVGTTVLNQLLTHIQALPEQPDLVVLTASRFGFPLYARMGFEYLFDYRIYASNSRD